MTPPRRQTATFSSANFGFVGCVSGLAALILPPLVLISLPAADCAWWRWLSGRDERGFRWVMAAMLIAHTVFVFWFLLLSAMTAESRGVVAAIVYLAMFFGSTTLVLRSAAGKCLAVGALMTAVCLSVLICYVNQQRESARRTGCLSNIRQLGLASFNHQHTPERLSSHSELPAVPSPAEEDGYSYIVKIMPYMEDEDLSGEVNSQAEALADEPLSKTLDE